MFRDAGPKASPRYPRCHRRPVSLRSAGSGLSMPPGHSSVAGPTDLVEQLVRLSDEQRLVAVKRAKTERRRRVVGAVQYIRRTMLAHVKSHRQAADAIDDAVNGRHRHLSPVLLSAIKQELK